MTNEYAIASRDELWTGGALAESRLAHGRAIRNGAELVADDTPDAALVQRCDARFAEMRGVIDALAPLRIRGVVEVSVEDGVALDSVTLTIAAGGMSIVTTPEHAMTDAAMLRALLATAPVTTVDGGAYPLVWRNGTAAVLFHEAAGHAAEHAQTDRVAWPEWLRVRDVSRAGDADLLAGESPRARRRATFRDVPMPRMTKLVAEQHAAPFALPAERIDVHLVAGGAYDPLTDEVTLRIAVADLVTRDRVQRVKPFELRRTRAAVARSIAGADGEPLRYPGVICSREGQELVVDSFAPVVITT